MQQSLSIQRATVSKAPAPRPFLKWAGGKGQIVDALADRFPPELNSGAIVKYAEPFIGGGAVFFYIVDRYPHIRRFYLSDVNQELVIAYTTIKNDVDELLKKLARLEATYHALSRAKQEAYYYDQRKKFNGRLKTIDVDTYGRAWIDRTASIIFLNRTCYNGLFRVNANGHFNVPFGDYKNPKISDPENLRAVSAAIQKAEIHHGDFTACESFCDSHTFVYFDPPYRPLTATASFTSYSTYDFDDDAQRRLAAYFRQLSAKGCKLMLSNSDPRNADPSDTFFDDLYQGLHIDSIPAARIINRDATKRGKISELVITNYKPG